MLFCTCIFLQILWFIKVLYLISLGIVRIIQTRISKSNFSLEFKWVFLLKIGRPSFQEQNICFILIYLYLGLFLNYFRFSNLFQRNLPTFQVERRERDDKRRASILLVRFYLQNGSLRLNQARRNLLERSKWHGSRVLSITPQIREFQALSSIKDIPILPIILKPANGSIHRCESKEPDLNRLPLPLRQMLMLSFNKSQLQAISAAIGFSSSKRDFELSLIQGPPGVSWFFLLLFFFINNSLPCLSFGHDSVSHGLKFLLYSGAKQGLGRLEL